MAPDYNSDRERHVDHKFVVQTAWPGVANKVKTSKGELEMNDKGRMIIKDEVLAREIQKEHPRDLAVTRMRTSKPADQGHRYHFGQMPPMPWVKYDELGRRIQEANNGTSRENDSNDIGNGCSDGQSESGRPTNGEGTTGEHE